MGEDCDVYRRDYCYAGTTIVGAQFNNPEMNCCGCGKEKQGKQNINNIVALKCNSKSSANIKMELDLYFYHINQGCNGGAVHMLYAVSTEPRFDSCSWCFCRACPRCTKCHGK